MGAYGQLKFEGQLSTLSASNIFQWYKEFRLNHQDKMVSPPASAKIEEPQYSSEMKDNVIKESFIKFISDPKQNDILLDMHFDKLVKIGLDLSKEHKRNLFNSELEKLIDNPPVEFYKDKKHREEVREIQNYYDSLEDKHKYDYNLMALNCMHKRCVRSTKLRTAIEFIREVGTEELIKRYEGKF